MKVYFLTEYSKEIGFGHLSRCLSLASVFQEKNYEVVFLIREWNEEPLELEFKKRQVEWADPETLNTVVSEEDILVIDSYRVASEVLNKIAVDHRRTVSVTDSKLNHANAGILVFGSVYGNENEIRNNKAEVLAGPEYVLFRKGVREATKNEIRTNVQEVLISLGGHADSSVLKKTIQTVQDQFDKCRIRIVGNSKVENSENVSNLGFLSLPDLLRELKKSDLVITNGGQSLNEVVLLEIPTVGISVADNQDKNLRAWQELGVLKHFIKSGSPDFQDKLRDSLEELKNDTLRFERVKKGRSIIDSDGAKRVVEKIEEWAKTK